jgi:DNA-binding NarL/FixJ family response regulator
MSTQPKPISADELQARGVRNVTTNHNHALASTFVDDFLPLPEIPSPPGALRDEAIANDAIGDASLPLARLWRELVQGECKVVDTFFSRTRCYVVTAPVEGRPAPRLDRRALEVLESVLRGCAQKNIALDLGLAPSTVTVIAQRGLQKLGVVSKPSRAHPLLMLAASAAFAQDDSIVGVLGVVARSGGALRVVSVPRPELREVGRLPGAEQAIVEFLVEGHSHAGIAALRGTSARTIANQVASVFRRFRVTCRSELVCRLFASSADRAAAPGGLAWCAAGATGLGYGQLPA